LTLFIARTKLAGSQFVWSMTKDKAFPFSEWLAVLNKRFGIPLRTIQVIDQTIGLIVLGNGLAFIPPSAAVERPSR
jgi:amino acid transporter